MYGGEFKEAPSLLKLGARRAVSLRAGEDARSVFEGTLPAPSRTPVPAAGVPPGLLSEGGVSPALPLELPAPFPGGGRKIGEVSCCPATSLPCQRPVLCPGTAATAGAPSPSDLYLPLPGRASTPPFPLLPRRPWA